MKLHLLLIITICTLLFVGCKSTSYEVNSAQTKAAPQNGTYLKHGTKLIVQYLPGKDMTSIFQQDLNIEPEMTVGGKKLNEKHRFEIHNTGSYKGKTVSAAPFGLAMTLTHVVANKKLWHFAPKTKLAFIADGERLEIPVTNQTKLDKDSPTETEFYETLIAEPTLEQYLKIANAKSGEIQIGADSFKLSSENILALKDFTDYLTKAS